MYKDMMVTLSYYYLVSLLCQVGFQVGNVANNLQERGSLVEVADLRGLSVHIVSYLPQGLLQCRKIYQ